MQGELDRVSQTLTGRIRELAERYAMPLPQLTDDVAALARPALAHRMALNFNARAEGLSVDALIDRLADEAA